MTRQFEIVSIQAVDWGMYSEQVDTDSEFEPINGWVHGAIVRESAEFVAIAHQTFHDGVQVRHVVAIPKACILQRIEHGRY